MSGDPKDGGWAPCRPAAWLRAVDLLPRPLAEDEAQTDLWVLNDVARQTRGTIPGYRALAARWGWSPHLARTLVAGTPGLCLSPRGSSRNGRAIVAHSRAIVAHSEPANADDCQILDRSSRNRRAFARNRRAPLLNGEDSPGTFEAPHKQTTEADDRQQQEDRTHVPQGAAPAALGPTDPTCDEPDWDALFAAVPLTYDEVDDERGAVDPEADSASVGSVAADRRDAPPEVGPAVEGDAPRAQPARSLRAAALGGDAPTDAVLSLPLTATQPPPVTRATDVDALWEAWRGYGTVRGRPNPKRRRLLERALEAHGLPAMLDLLAAAHGGADRYWRFLQGATPESDTTYLSPETLLNGRLDERVERAAAWVEAGRPTHDVAETRVEVRAEVAVRSLTQRARDAWDKVVMPNRGSKSRFDAALAAFGTSEKADEARRAVLGGLSEAKGLSAIGMATEYTRPEKMRAFVRGFVAALGGEVTEAELREVG